MDTTNRTANPSVIVGFPKFRSVLHLTILLPLHESIGGVAMSALAMNDEVFTSPGE